MINLLAADWVMDSIRKIGGFIDKAVYGFIEFIMQLILDLSNTEIFSETVIDEFATRIYIILGLVMLFKIMISFIQILINPDKMDDKEQGVTGVLKRVIISLGLIFLVPSIFDLARQVQGYVIPVIPRVLLGVTVDDTNEGDESLDGIGDINRVGQIMSYYSFLPFIDYNQGCDDGSIMGPMNDNADNITIWSVDTAIDAIKNDQGNACANGDYKYKYSWPLSTVVGVYLLFVLVSVAVSIAIRTIKLGVCEFIAPLPIASYIDPKTSKQAFDNWVSTTVKTYLDLFIRLIIVYFVVFVFMTIFRKENIEAIYGNLGGSFWRGALVTLFLIIGLLQFVKQAPKFISDMLGIKGGGDFMGMFKGEGWKTLGKTFATPAGALTAGVGNAINAKMSGKTFGQGLKSAVAGFGSGLWHGSRAVLSGKSGKEVWNSSTQTPWSRRNIRTTNQLSGSTFGGRMKIAARDYLQLSDDISLSEGILKSLNSVHSGVGSHKQSVFKQIDKDGNVGFYGAHRGESKTIQSIGELLSENMSTINSQGNADLKNIINGKFQFDSSTGKWKLTAGSKFGYDDLKALEAAAAQSGIGTLSAKLAEGGSIRLGAQKEIYESANLGHVETRSGSTYNDFLENPDFANPRRSIEADLKKNAADFIGMDVDGFGKIERAEDVLIAFNLNPKKFDDAVQERIRDVQGQNADNLDAVNRAANQRWKSKP